MLRLRLIGFAFLATVAVYVVVGWLLINVLQFEGVMQIPLVVAASIAVDTGPFATAAMSACSLSAVTLV